MNLYASHKRVESPIFTSNYTLITKGGKLLMITSIDGSDLKVLSYDGKFYLVKDFVLSAGVASVIFTSDNLKRVVGYGDALVKTKMQYA